MWKQRQVLQRGGDKVRVTCLPRKPRGLYSGVPSSPCSPVGTGCCSQGVLSVPRPLMCRWIPFPSGPGQTKGCDWCGVSCLTSHPFTQHRLLRACSVPSPRLQGRWTSPCCLLVTLLVLVGLGGPIVRGSQGGFHEQVDLGLELGAREVRQVTLGVSSEVPPSSHPSWDSFPHVPPRH